MRWLGIVMCAGCGFKPAALHDMTNDASPGSDAPAVSDGRVDGSVDAPKPTCNTSDSSLVWCLEFDEPNLGTATTAIDGSGKHHDPAISGFSVTTRDVPVISPAIQTNGTGAIQMTKPSDFDLQNFTLSAWIQRNSNNELGIIDTANQYTLNVSNSAARNIECSIGHGIVTVYGGDPTGTEWDFLACTYDQNQVCAYVYRSGNASNSMGQQCFDRTSATDTGGTITTAGEWANGQMHFSGKLDSVRVYSRALTQQELCTANGITNC